MELEDWTMIGYRQPLSWERNQGYGPDKMWPIFQSDKYPLLTITRVRSEESTRRGWRHQFPNDIHDAATCPHWKQHAEIHGWELVREPVLQVTVRRKPFKIQNVTELFSFTFDEWMEYWEYPYENYIAPDYNEGWATRDPSDIITAYEAWIEAKSISPTTEEKRKKWRDYIEQK